jgi:hypothetical protein
MGRGVGCRRWLVRILFIAIVAASVGPGCRSWRNGAEMTEPRPIFNGK